MSAIAVPTPLITADLRWLKLSLRKQSESGGGPRVCHHARGLAPGVEITSCDDCAR
jgi:hypothetical protein